MGLLYYPRRRLCQKSKRRGVKGGDSFYIDPYQREAKTSPYRHRGMKDKKRGVGGFDAVTRNSGKVGDAKGVKGMNCAQERREAEE